MFVVVIVVSIPMSEDDFTEDKQAAFKTSVAIVAGVPKEDVTIVRIEIISTRRLLSESIRVEISVKAKDRSSANYIASKLTALQINRELTKIGLPAVGIIEPASIHKSPKDDSSGSSHALIIGCTVAGVVVLAGIALYLWQRIQHNKDVAAAAVVQQETRAPVEMAPVRQDECFENLPDDVEISLSSSDNRVVNRV